MRRILVGCLLGCLGAALLSAAPIVTWGQGSAVTSADRSATFNSIATGTDLSAYSESGLSITIPNSAYTNFTPGIGFSGGFHYPSGGYNAPTRIRTVDNLLMFALEVHLGSGFYGHMGANAYFAWDTWSNGLQTGSGYFTRHLGSEQIFGISDQAGFTLLRIANYETLQHAQNGLDAGALNAVALDNLLVQLAPGQPGGEIPEPGTLLLAGIGVLLVLVKRFR